ncbi:DGQHR domain-containing protein [Pseudomonas aeruginosa]|uniref:DGQHR domain-containing protein n=1 Tax=Pseudomonas aeruginosa TaxID=287 RepID=UPI0023401FF5|nr:DGQHR domain-containing protein [Pseudomonas aeruginosa]MDC3993169.1 DGQHR domain-containing protein [Pseudomonas aeruginosa]
MRNYLGFLVRQRANSNIDFIVLVANAEDIVQWSQADDIRIDRGNVQRQLVESRWRQVKKFFSASNNNIIPTSVTIAFDEELTRVESKDQLREDEATYYISAPREDGIIEIAFPDKVQSRSFIIDGQHRLKGMASVGEPVFVPVCLFPSLSRLERAFQFVTINNKSHKVPTSNLKALITNFDGIEEGLRNRLSQASITAHKFATHVDVMNEDSDSPFHKLIDWVNNRYPDKKAVISPAAIENSLKAINNGFPETKDDPADAITVMSAIWRRIFQNYDIDFNNIEDVPNLTKKPVIQRVTELVVEHLRRELDPAFSTGNIMTNNANQAGEAADKLITLIPIEFWQDEWALKSLDTSAGRDIISQSIRVLKTQLAKNQDEDFDWRKDNPLYQQNEDTDIDNN